jgi:hypothetical protein
MAANFDIGDSQRPRGHALVYFRPAGNSRAVDGELLATYVVVLPIAINPAKYIPPAFAAHMPVQPAAVDATALPPIPEAIGDLATLRRLAEYRGDDLLDGGVVEDETDRLMMATHEVSRDYAERYQAALAAQVAQEAVPTPTSPAGPGDGEAVPDEDTLRWMFLDERGRIGELAKLTGQLRYAVDGGDEHLIRSTTEQVRRLKGYLTEKYRIEEFLAGASRPGEIGRRLAELYIERCYKLGNEQYEDLGRIDQEIAALEGQSSKS